MQARGLLDIWNSSRHHLVREMHGRFRPRPGATCLRLALWVRDPAEGPRHLTSLAHLRCREPAVAGHKLRQQACARSTTLAGSSCETLEGAPTPECAHVGELCVVEAEALSACWPHTSADVITASPKIPTGGRTSLCRVKGACTLPEAGPVHASHKPRLCMYVCRVHVVLSCSCGLTGDGPKGMARTLTLTGRV